MFVYFASEADLFQDPGIFEYSVRFVLPSQPVDATHALNPSPMKIKSGIVYLEYNATRAHY
jgi:hypothetical protein